MRLEREAGNRIDKSRRPAKRPCADGQARPYQVRHCYPYDVRIDLGVKFRLLSLIFHGMPFA
jgi:hypothetical protein